MKALRIFSRIFVGLVFMFSGFVKSVDPLGFTYKLQEYMISYHMDWFSNMALYIAIFLCAVEFVLGVALVFNAKMKIVAWLTLVMMLFFTGLTFYSAVANPVSDCGCFGDAIKLTNWETFYKNVVLMVFVIIIVFTRKKDDFNLSNKSQWASIVGGTAFLLSISIYSYRHLPIIDFLPWKIGNKISEQVVPTPEIAKVFLIYKNKKTGEVKEYPSDNFPWQDSVWVENWEFKDQRKEISQPFKEAPIHDFSISDQDGNDFTEQFIGNPKYQFILVTYLVEKADKGVFKEKINDFAKKCESDSVSFIGVSGSSFEVMDNFRHEVQAGFNFYSTDATALKSMVRANPGLLLLKNGVVIDKWHYNDFPDYAKMKEKYSFKK